MRKLSTIILITTLAISCFGFLIPVFAQETISSADNTATPAPLIVRWMRFRGAITTWGDETYHGSVTINAKTANVFSAIFKPWATVQAVWSNEQRPITSAEKPTGEVTYTHYNAKLVFMQTIRGARADPAFDLNITGLWNVNKVVITNKFDDKGVLLSSIREVTPIISKAKGQMHITNDWKAFDIEIQGIDTIKGNAIGMTTATNMINPFSYDGSQRPTLTDLHQIARCYRAMPGFGNYINDLDFNMDSKIDLSDLTTVAANI
jgi:hypothetical protein